MVGRLAITFCRHVLIADFSSCTEERRVQELPLEVARVSTTELLVGIHTHETIRLRRRLYLLQVRR